MKNILTLSIIAFIINSCGVTLDTTPSTSSSSSSNSSVPSIAQDRVDTLNRHNQIRNELFSGSNLIWSDVVEKSAQDYANTLAQNGKFEHSGGGYGENLYASSTNSSMKNGLEAWYSEKPAYSYNTNSCASGHICGHYTQVIWKNTTEVGCAKATYTTGRFNGGTVVVCQYNQAGNYVGEKPY